MKLFKSVLSTFFFALTASADPLVREFHFPGNGTAGPYPLGARFIIVDSDSVLVNGVYRPRDSYTLNYETGELTFSQPVPGSAAVSVFFKKLPFDLRPGYAHRQLIPAGPTVAPASPSDTAVEKMPPETLRSETASSLSASGTKTVGVEFGSQGPLSLEQSLRLNLKGSLAGIALDAALSDQQTPIPPEGTTRDLSQLDQIHINLEGHGLSGSFGDCALSLPLARFGTVDRKLTGGIGAVSVKGLKLNGAAAQAKGVRTVNRFAGDDGRQGPYTLTGGDALITVVAGSEVVHLDGERMVRGWDNDYTIDYSSAQVTFTNKRLVTARSRIEIEFEYTAASFARYSYNLGARYAVAPATFGVQVFQESDDPNRSLKTALTQTQRAALSSIGDDTARAWVDGASNVGPNKGSYVKEGDHYRFVGADQAGTPRGDYLVGFSFVGDGKGDYIYDSVLGGYVYVGLNQGRYVSKIYIDLPKKNELAVATVNLRRDGLSCDLVGLATRQDRNLFSAIGDADNTGLGYAVGAGWENRLLSVGYERSYTGTGLWLDRRTEDVDFEHTWGVKPPAVERSLDQAKLSLRPLANLSFNLGGGLLSSGTMRTERVHFDGRFRSTQYFLQILKNGVQHRLSLSEPVGMLVPRIVLVRETSDSSRFWDGLAGLDVSAPSSLNLPLTLGASFERRDDARKDSAWLRESRTETYRLLVTTRGIAGLTVSGIAGYNQKKYLQVAGSNFANYFTTLRSSYTHPRGITGRLDIDQTRNQTQATTVNYLKVAKGTGDYSYDPETRTFYPDPRGDYLRQTVPSGSLIPVRDLNLSSNVDLTFIRQLEIRGFYTGRENRTDSSLLRSTRNYDLTATIFPFEPKFSLALENGGTSVTDALSSEPVNDLASRYAAEARSNIADPVFLKARTEYTISNRNRIGAGLEKNQTEAKITFEPSVNLAFTILLRLGLSHKSIALPLFYPELGTFPLDNRNLGIGCQVPALTSTRIGVDVDFFYRTSTTNTLPYELAQTDPLGFTPKWQVTADRSLTDELVLSLQYRGIDPPGKPVDHSFSANLRAYF